jgi:tRNA nucleotidyltransferase (CCA-adding enzyme)
VALLNELFQSSQNFVIHGVQVTFATASSEKYIGDIAVLAHKLRDIENAEVLFVLVRLEGRVHLVARSRVPAVNVGALLRSFGGGGHASAASATVRDLTLIQLKERLLQLLGEEIPPLKLAGQIMTAPAKTISTSATLREAKDLFLRYNINNLPVTSPQGILLGIINRQVIDKALGHGLGASSVTEVMLTEVETVSPQDDLDTIKQRMMERHQQFLPVLGNKRVVGVITRTDLLRILHEKLVPLSPEKGILRGYSHKKNLKGLLQERLPQSIQEILHLAGTVAEELGFGIYVVGGMVRDMLLRMDNFDVDLVVEKDGILFARRLAERVGGHCRAHEKFATAVVVFPDGFKLDVATARTEYYRHPAALPIVEQSSIKQDLYRRDFTINALAIKLNPGEFGSLIDFFGGQQDLKNGAIRVLHSLSLVEDPTRVFRAIRFEQRFGFRIGKHTLSLIRNALKKDLCAYLDGRRLLNELCMIFQESEPYRAIQRMSKLDLLRCIHPSLKPSQQELQLFSRLKTVLDWYNLLFLEKRAERWFLFLSGLASYLSQQECQELAQRLDLNEKQTLALLRAQRQITPLLTQLQRQKSYSPSQLYALLKPAPLETLLLVMAKTGSPLAKQRLSLYLTKLQHEKVLISGRELKGLDLSPGPVFGQIKQELLYAHLDGKLKTREDELAWVERRFKKGETTHAATPNRQPPGRGRAGKSNF